MSRNSFRTTLASAALLGIAGAASAAVGDLFPIQPKFSSGGDLYEYVGLPMSGNDSANVIIRFDDVSAATDITSDPISLEYYDIDGNSIGNSPDLDDSNYTEVTGNADGNIDDGEIWQFDLQPVLSTAPSNAYSFDVIFADPDATDDSLGAGVDGFPNAGFPDDSDDEFFEIIRNAPTCSQFLARPNSGDPVNSEYFFAATFPTIGDGMVAPFQDRLQIPDQVAIANPNQFDGAAQAGDYSFFTDAGGTNPATPANFAGITAVNLVSNNSAVTGAYDAGQNTGLPGQFVSFNVADGVRSAAGHFLRPSGGVTTPIGAYAEYNVTGVCVYQAVPDGSSDDSVLGITMNQPINPNNIPNANSFRIDLVDGVGNVVQLPTNSIDTLGVNPADPFQYLADVTLPSDIQIDPDGLTSDDNGPAGPTTGGDGFPLRVNIDENGNVVESIYTAANGGSFLGDGNDDEGFSSNAIDKRPPRLIGVAFGDTSGTGGFPDGAQDQVIAIFDEPIVFGGAASGFRAGLRDSVPTTPFNAFDPFNGLPPNAVLTGRDVGTPLNNNIPLMNPAAGRVDITPFNLPNEGGGVNAGFNNNDGLLSRLEQVVDPNTQDPRFNGILFDWDPFAEDLDGDGVVTPATPIGTPVITGEPFPGTGTFGGGENLSALQLFFNATAAPVQYAVGVGDGFTDENVEAGAGIITDVAGNVFLGNSVLDEDAGTFAPAAAGAINVAVDKAAPAALVIGHSEGDNSLFNDGTGGGGNPAGTIVIAPHQTFVEQDVFANQTAGGNPAPILANLDDQAANDLLMVVASEPFVLPGNGVFQANNLTFGGGDFFASNSLLNNNTYGGVGPFAFAPLSGVGNTVAFQVDPAPNAANPPASDPGAYGPGVTSNLFPQGIFGNGLDDAAQNELTWLNRTVGACAAPYVETVLDVNQAPQVGIFALEDPANPGFVGSIQGTFTQDIDPDSLPPAGDFNVNFGGAVTAVTLTSPNVVTWGITPATIALGNPIVFTYNAQLVGTTPFRFDDGVAGQSTGAPVFVPLPGAVTPLNYLSLGGGNNPFVIPLQQPFVDTPDVAIQDFTGQLLLPDPTDPGNTALTIPAPQGTKIYAFNPMLVANEITANHNNIPFGYRTDDPIYTAGGLFNGPNAGGPFADVYLSLTAFTNWLHGIAGGDDVYLHRDGGNQQRFTNTKLNPYFNNTFGFDDANGPLVDSIRMNINAGNLTRITFSGRGEQGGDRVSRGTVGLAWDFIRSNDGTLSSFVRQGWAPQGMPVPAGSDVIESIDGTFAMRVSRPIFEFTGLGSDASGRRDLFRNIDQPLVFVAELPDGTRYALSGLLTSALNNDHDGDGQFGDAILFQELPGNQEDGVPAASPFLDFRVHNVGSNVVRSGWNLIPLDRACGVVTTNSRNRPALPNGLADVSPEPIIFINTSRLPWASPLDAGVFWVDGDPTLTGGAPASLLGGGAVNYPGGDGIWTAADDFAPGFAGGSGVGVVGAPSGFMSSMMIDADRIPHFAFTMTTDGIELNEGITSAVGGYSVAFFNNSYINGLHNNDFGVMGFGPPLQSNTVFPPSSDPISTGNRNRTQGWILAAVTDTFASGGDFLTANSVHPNNNADYVITFRTGRLNPVAAVGLGAAQNPDGDGGPVTHSPVTIDVQSSSNGTIASPNDLGAVGFEAVFLHYTRN